MKVFWGKPNSSAHALKLVSCTLSYKLSESMIDLRIARSYPALSENEEQVSAPFWREAPRLDLNIPAADRGRKSSYVIGIASKTPRLRRVSRVAPCCGTMFPVPTEQRYSKYTRPARRNSSQLSGYCAKACAIVASCCSGSEHELLDILAMAVLNNWSYKRLPAGVTAAPRSSISPKRALCEPFTNTFCAVGNFTCSSRARKLV